MRQPHFSESSKLIMGMISAQEELFEKACQRLSSPWGEVDFVSPVFPFSHTKYYQPEMGDNLLRQFVAFRKLIDPEDLSSYKLISDQLEAEFADEQGNRRINLDPGYLNFHQLVLASTKNFSHRIYLGEGIYADLTLQYKKGRGWQDLPWTYPDYQSETTKDFFSQVRRQYRKQINASD